MVTVRNLLHVKGDAIWSVTPQTPILDALQFMAQKNVGALVVLEEGRLAGIISERDFVQKIAGVGDCIRTDVVDKYMTKVVFTVTPDQTIEECMQMMTYKHIRHLPVMDEDRLVGLISIGDVVKSLISAKESTINQLEDYIQGRGYGQ